MSTAIGHGLADPKRRGKPVSYANKAWCVACPMGAQGLFLEGGEGGGYNQIASFFFSLGLSSFLLGVGESKRTYTNRRIERESG